MNEDLNPNGILIFPKEILLICKFGLWPDFKVTPFEFMDVRVAILWNKSGKKNDTVAKRKLQYFTFMTS